MIIDEVKYLERYREVPHIDEIVLFLRRSDLKDLAAPEIEIKGRDLFVRIMRYTPKPKEQQKMESHRVYADVQVVLEGIELMQTGKPSELTPTCEYDAKGDYQFYTCDRQLTDLVIRKNEFAVFFPGEAHRPSCRYENETGPVWKLVFKVRM